MTWSTGMMRTRHSWVTNVLKVYSQLCSFSGIKDRCRRWHMPTTMTTYMMNSLCCSSPTLCCAATSIFSSFTYNLLTIFFISVSVYVNVLFLWHMANIHICCSKAVNHQQPWYLVYSIVCNFVICLCPVKISGKNLMGIISHINPNSISNKNAFQPIEELIREKLIPAAFTLSCNTLISWNFFLIYLLFCLYTPVVFSPFLCILVPFTVFLCGIAVIASC